MSLDLPPLEIPETEEGRTEYAKAILRAAGQDGDFDNTTSDEDMWLRAWCGLASWDEVNTAGRCEHGFIVGECWNEGCPASHRGADQAAAGELTA